MEGSNSFPLGPFRPTARRRPTSSAARRRRHRQRSPLATSPGSVPCPDLPPPAPKQQSTRGLISSAAAGVEPSIHCVSIHLGCGGDAACHCQAPEGSYLLPGGR
uniref:Uncharacterized protein n=1 Tax=Setaria italica TaxID=4555 RepID=K3ZYC1_SETIT